MAEDQVSISNSALTDAGGRAVIATAADNTKEAKTCAQYFSRTVRSVLALVPWDFATTTAQLTTLLTTVPLEPPYTSAFARPSDALVLQDVFAQTAGASPSVPIFPGSYGQAQSVRGRLPFATGNIGGQRVIYSIATAAAAKYTSWVTDFSLWSPMAIELLVTSLAAKIAFPISGDKGLRDRLKQEVSVLESRARILNANETIDVVDMPVDWMLAREAECFYLPQPIANQSLSQQLIDPNVLANLPTAQPASSGILWNDSGLVAVS